MMAQDQTDARMRPTITNWTTMWAWRNSSMKET
jgi:hypothetical protein